MYKKLFLIILTLAFVALNLNLFNKTATVNINVDGVYQSNMNDIDFSYELTGQLSEGVILAKADKIGNSKPVAGVVNANKIISWGLSRRPDNGIPAADPGAPELLKKYNGAYIGDINKKEIYLTFDEGYENGYTPKILDVLKVNNVKAVFFITGPYLKDHQDLVRRMIEEGHTVGNHTIHHPSLPSLSEQDVEEEVLGLDRAFHEKFGKNMKYLRPPKGEYNEKTLAITNALGYKNLFWSFAYDDWYRDKSRGADYAYNIVMKNLHNGAVLLLHAVSKDNADALDRIIKGAIDKGYTFGNINNIN